ncbi:hypothetical protein SAMN05216266_10414 [Amycolatopsis marina]|uniref:Uncharacterized protein n=1 Tax=Amycolatopsis marina TaxID=490629 RepID=A0A1I0XU78_9PSEU|nr:hypothetical protein SAMN05216266_10414 [Amycolatopsis marina]
MILVFVGLRARQMCSIPLCLSPSTAPTSENVTLSRNVSTVTATCRVPISFRVDREALQRTSEVRHARSEFYHGCKGASQM